MAEKKVFVLGLDGFPFHRLDKWLKEDRLPNLKHIAKNGVYGPLKSVIPFITAPAWRSFATGTNPGKHGIYGFSERRQDSYRFNLSIKYDPARKKDSLPFIWEILNESGLKIGLVNVPMTYPPADIDGFIISGMLTPNESSKFTHPESLKKELYEEIGDYRIDVTKLSYDINKRSRSPEIENLLEDLYYITQKRKEAILYLMKNHDWALFIAVFTGTDRIQHRFWDIVSYDNLSSDEKERYQDAIIKYFQYMDEIIGGIVKILDSNDTLIILSDHGFGALKKEISINAWLAQNGFLKTKGFPSDILRRIGITRENMEQGLAKTGFISFADKIDRLLGLREKIPGIFPELIDWTQTKAYCLGEGKIYINLKEREPRGVVSAGKEYENLREDLMQKLLDLRDPVLGSRCVKNVYRREDIYGGSQIEKAPDLIIDTLSKGYTTTYKFFPQVFMEPKKETGTHRKMGILIMQGPEIKSGKRLEPASIMSLAPTILYLFNHPIPTYMDGQVLKEAFKNSYVKSNPPKTAETHISRQSEYKGLSDEEEEDLIKRLKALGYLS